VVDFYKHGNELLYSIKKSNRVEFTLDKVALEHDFVRVLRSSLPIFIPYSLIIVLSILRSFDTDIDFK
jgi:hypothetical protein